MYALLEKQNKQTKKPGFPILLYGFLSPFYALEPDYNKQKNAEGTAQYHGGKFKAKKAQTIIRIKRKAN